MHRGGPEWIEALERNPNCLFADQELANACELPGSNRKTLWAAHPTIRAMETGVHGSSTVSKVVIYILQAWQNFLGLPRPAQRIFMRCVVPHLGQTHSMVIPSPH
jgi:hypothetical protein